MQLVLAMDLQRGIVVSGKSGNRSTYKPLDWGLSSTAEPSGYIRAVRPRYLYIADLDRIAGTGSHDAVIRDCARSVGRCYVDRGSQSPGDFISGYHITNVTGTETGGEDLSRYNGGFLSLDQKDGRVIPFNRDPVEMLRQANSWKFDGCIILDIGAIGTESGLNSRILAIMRSAYHRKLFWGGGVGSTTDLDLLCNAGFAGAIIATALHRGAVPHDSVRRGIWC